MELELFEQMQEPLNILQHPLVQKIGILTAGIVVLILLSTGVRHLIQKSINDTNVRYNLQKGNRFVLYLLFLWLAMAVFEVRVEGITVAFGVAGAGIAFALQEVIVTVAGYIAIFAGRFFHVGDRIEMGGIRGDVVDIGILRTTLMQVGDWVDGDLYNGKMVRIANSFIFKEPVFNYSGKFPFLWDEIRIPLRTTSDYAFAETMIEQIAKEELSGYATEAQRHWHKMTTSYKLEHARVDPMVTMRFDENWITFTLRYVVDYKQRRTVQSRLFKQILDAINQHPDKVEVATAAMEVTNVN